MRVEEFEKLTKKELRAKANECFTAAEPAGELVRTALLTEARFYLDEVNRRADSWVSRRDLFLEIVVILLIGGEIFLGIYEGNQQANAEGEQRWFTQDEVGRIAEAARGQYKVLFHLAAYSGLRFGELAGLHVEDLDVARGVICVRRSVWHGKEVSPKSRKGYRDVFVDSGTVQMLRTHLGDRTSGRIFQTRTGTPLENHNVVRQVLKPVCKQLGIESGGMHAFRHGRVSHLQQSGVPTDFTKNQVGHSSLRTTSGYTHFSEKFVRETVERVATESLSRTHSQQLDSLSVGAN